MLPSMATGLLDVALWVEQINTSSSIWEMAVGQNGSFSLDLSVRQSKKFAFSVKASYTPSLMYCRATAFCMENDSHESGFE